MKVEMELIRRGNYSTRALKPIRYKFSEPAATYLEARGAARRVTPEEVAAEESQTKRSRGRKRKGAVG